jgi:hypothetical protein
VNDVWAERSLAVASRRSLYNEREDTVALIRTLSDR